MAMQVKLSAVSNSASATIPAGTEPITVNFSTADESAITSLDYGGGTSSVTFNPGESQKTITIAVAGDSTHALMRGRDAPLGQRSHS